MSIEPAFEAFEGGHRGGRPQIVWTRLVDDLETPVSAYLKIAHDEPYAFLFESVEGGAWRGRYSVVAMRPDLVWRCRGDKAEIARGDAIARDDFAAEDARALDSLRDLVARTRIDLPKGLPPMSAGIFGAMGYDMVRLVERLPHINPDPLDLPDAVMIRPSIVAIFDSIGQEIILATTVWPSGETAAEAYAAASARIKAVVTDLAAPLPAAAPRSPQAPRPFESKVSPAGYGALVERAKRYIEAGDIFQVVPSHRFKADFDLPPLALYRSLRRLNP